MKKNATRSQEFSDSIIDTIHEPLIVLDNDLRVVTASRSFYEFFKVKPEDTVGQLIYDLGNKQWDIPKLRELLEAIIPQKTTFDNYEVEHDFVTIGKRIMLLNARQIERALGKERIILLAIEDITERRRLEDILTESEELYRGVFRTASDGILLLEKREGKITHMNPAAEKMLGYSTKEIIGNKLQDVGFMLDMVDFQMIMQNLNKNGIINYTDIPVTTKSGQQMHTDIYLVNKTIAVQCNIRDITERKQADEALRASEERFSKVFQASPAPTYISTISDGRYIDVNNSGLQLVGYTGEEMIGHTIRELGIWHTSSERKPILQKLIVQGSIRNEPVLLRTKNGEVKEILLSCEIIRLNDEEVMLSLVYDITERKQAEKELHRLNRELRAISSCNQVLVRTQNEQALLNDICRIICDKAGYRMAWVGYVEYDDEKTVCPVAWGGFDDGYVTNTKLSWADDAERAQDPGGAAIRSGKTVYIQDFSTDPRTAPWQESALQRGYRSAIALPLKDENANVFGVLLIYSIEINSFSPYEIGILEELASDLSFGITALRTRVKRDQTEVELRESEERYRLIAENTADTIAIFDLNLNPTYISPSILKLRGYTVQEAMTQTLYQTLTPDSLQQASKMFADQMALESSGTADPARTALIDLEEYCKDGSTIWVELAASFLRDKNFKPIGILTVTRNITERKQAEERLKETLDSLRKSVGATIQVMVAAVEMRDPYTAGHQIRTAHLACAIATEIGLTQEKIDGIRMAGSIHDIGKLSIPAEILSKPTKLTDIEFSLIKEHSRSGYEMLKDVESPWPLAQIVYQHHERMDGSGYPRNLKGNEILIEARIMAVADVVEAMASHRPYRPGLGIDAALAEIEKNRGIHYDNTVADACLRLFRKKGYQLT